MSTKPREEVLLVVWRTDNLFRHMVWAVFRYWYMCGSCFSVSDSLVWDQTLGTAKQPHLFSEAASHTAAEMAPWGQGSWSWTLRSPKCPHLCEVVAAAVRLNSRTISQQRDAHGELLKRIRRVDLQS